MKTTTKALEWHEKFGLLPNPKNQYQQAIWYLYNWDKFSLVDVINDNMFFKFQSRLSDIENEIFSLIASRERVKFTNKFGRKSTFFIYSRCVSKKKLAEIFVKYD